MCCVILLPFLIWLAAATNPLSSDQLGSNINAILFMNAAAAIAATAKLPLLLRALLLPLPSPLCGGIFQNIYCCKYLICQHHCYCYYGCCHHQVAVVVACRCYHCGENKRTSIMLHIFIHFALAMMMVRAMGKAMAMKTATGITMIYHCLFHDSNETIVAIIYFSFLVDENAERICG